MKLFGKIGLSILVFMLIATNYCWANPMAVAKEALDQGDCEKAEQALQEFVKTDRYNAFLYVWGISIIQASDQSTCPDFDINFINDGIAFSEENGLKNYFLYEERANIWAQKMEYENALADYSKSIELEAGYSNLGAMAWFRATCPDANYRNGEEAVEYGLQAIEKRGKEAEGDFKILAAAYAEAGNFPEAIQAQEKALTLLKDKTYSNLQEIQTQYEEYLASYKADTPWRMESPK